MGILGGVYGGAVIALYLKTLLEKIPLTAPIAQSLSLFIVVLTITFLFLVMGEIIPKRLAMLHPERISVVFALPMFYLSRITAPAVYIISAVSDGILNVFGIRQHHEEEPMSEEEIKQLFMQGARTGVFHPIEINLVERVLKLDDRSVGHLMTQPKDIVWFEKNETVRQCMEKVRNTGHTCFPVARGGLDDIVGIVWVKDLLGELCEARPTLKKIIKPVVYAPVHLNSLQILDRFQDTRSHMILIVDKSEVLQGLVTINDILQTIIGELPYPSWVKEPGIVRRDDGSLLVDAHLPLCRLTKALKIARFSRKKGVGYKTIADWVIQQTGHIPISGESFSWEGYRFEVVDMDGPHVDKILITAESDIK